MISDCHQTDDISDIDETVAAYEILVWKYTMIYVYDDKNNTNDGNDDDNNDFNDVSHDDDNDSDDEKCCEDEDGR